MFISPRKSIFRAGLSRIQTSVRGLPKGAFSSLRMTGKPLAKRMSKRPIQASGAVAFGASISSGVFTAGICADTWEKPSGRAAKTSVEVAITSAPCTISTEKCCVERLVRFSATCTSNAPLATGAQ